MRFGLACMLILVACAGAGPGSGSKDGGPQNGLCPAHPDQCGGKCCGANCVEIMLDIHNCGDCGVLCATGQVCSGGGCGCPSPGGGAAPCGMGQSCCGLNGCKSLMSDINNCGTCGRGCGVGSTCAGGKCVCGATACGATQVCCNGACADSCAMPDMAMAIPDGGAGGLCQCAGMCPLSKFCVGPNCCFEQAFVNACTPSATCTPQMYP